MASPLAVAIRLAREHHGLSQLDLAVRIGLTSQSNISRLENGGVNVSAAMLARVATALGEDTWAMLARAVREHRRQVKCGTGGRGSFL